MNYLFKFTLIFLSFHFFLGEPLHAQVHPEKVEIKIRPFISETPFIAFNQKVETEGTSRLTDRISQTPRFKIMGGLDAPYQALGRVEDISYLRCKACLPDISPQEIFLAQVKIALIISKEKEKVFDREVEGYYAAKDDNGLSNLMQAFMQAIDIITLKLYNEFPVWGSLIKASRLHFLTGLGTNHGVEPGDILEVEDKGKPIGIGEVIPGNHLTPTQCTARWVDDLLVEEPKVGVEVKLFKRIKKDSPEHAALRCIFGTAGDDMISYLRFKEKEDISHNMIVKYDLNLISLFKDINNRLGEPDKKFKVALTANLNKIFFKIGDKIKIYFHASFDCRDPLRGYLLYVTANNKVYLLFPNHEIREFEIESEKQYMFPYTGCGIKPENLTVELSDDQKNGIDLVKIIVTDSSKISFLDTKLNKALESGKGYATLSLTDMSELGKELKVLKWNFFDLPVKIER